MADRKSVEIRAHTRALMQSAKLAIRDVFDAIVELVTNADDRFQMLQRPGRIEIEVERRRGGNTSILRVRDFADGMDAATMKRKLSVIGGRESGMKEGAEVRGTHSRGAKDVAALGKVTFESIAASDGQYHRCQISEYLEFVQPETTPDSADVRASIGIPTGSGTLVTVEVDPNNRVPQHEKLKEQIQRLVGLRGVLRDGKRTLVLRDLRRGREDQLSYQPVLGHERVNERFDVPGYAGVEAKLTIYRAKRRLERERDRFREGGIQVESKRGVHQATLFDSALESDPNAQWFFGRLVCPYIDHLCNEFDDYFEARKPLPQSNPTYLLDPSRRSGLTREHPFTRALFGEALKRVRPLVEEERRREEHEKAEIENKETRRRLNALEKAAAAFMKDFDTEDEPARDPDGRDSESRFMERGWSLSPPFAQMIVGHSRLYWINIRQAAFPELEVGSGVQIECLTKDVTADKHVCGLEVHPTREGVLRAVWRVKALSATTASGIRVRVGSITAESVLEVLASEADRYRHVVGLQFGKSRYTIRTNQKHRKIRILAPIGLAPAAVPVRVAVNSPQFRISGQQMLHPNRTLNVSLCDLSIESDGKAASGRIEAQLGSQIASASVSSVPPAGANLKIKLQDIDLVSQRYRWNKNVLEIAARHPSLKRYLGTRQENFPGQDSKHFRLLLAEIVAEAVCAQLVSRAIRANPEEFEDADWDLYYQLYTKYMTGFLPKAHQLQCPNE